MFSPLEMQRAQTFFSPGQTLRSLFGEVPHTSSPPRSCRVWITWSRPSCSVLHTAHTRKACVQKTCRPIYIRESTTSWPHAACRASKSSIARTSCRSESCVQSSHAEHERGKAFFACVFSTQQSSKENLPMNLAKRTPSDVAKAPSPQQDEQLCTAQACSADKKL